MMADISTDRKVIQIMPVVVPGMDNMSAPTIGMMALCDDGTIWHSGISSGMYHSNWEQVPGPEHLGELQSSYSTRRDLQELLTKDKYEKVAKLLRSGGVRF